MNTYLDLSYFYSIIVVFTMPYYFKRLLNTNFSMLEVVTLSIFNIVLYFNCFIFKEYNYMNILFMFCYFAIVYFKKCIKYFFVYLFSYYSSVSYGIILSNNIYIYKGLVMLNEYKSFLLFWTIFVSIFYYKEDQIIIKL